MRPRRGPAPADGPGGPGRLAAGSVSYKPTISEDIFCTVAEIINGTVLQNQQLDGRSVLHDLAEPSESAVDLHWYYPHYSPQAKAPAAAILSEGFKLIEFYDPVRVELYDLNMDISESHDLSAEQPDRVKILRQKLHAWLDKTDPVRHALNPAYRQNSVQID